MFQAVGEQAASAQNTVLGRLYSPQDPTGLPTATDWSCRPDLWAAPIDPKGYVPASPQTRLSGQVTLYHDCKSPGPCLRQISPARRNKPGAFALKIEVFDFDGSFLSLVLQSPSSLLEGLDKTHILRVFMQIECERPIEMSLRLNLQHGPNTEQVSKDVTLSDGGAVTEFDLAYVPFRENQIEQVWFDLFIEKPSMNAITIHDLILSRHRRAAI